MMAVNVKRLNSDERVWLDRQGAPINVDRAWHKSDRVIAERQREERHLAMASLDVEGTRRWFALRAGNRGEIDLRDRLIDSRVDAVVPVKQVPVKRRFKVECRKVVHRPVLAGLVFVNIVPSDEAFSGLLRVKGVASLVGTNDKQFRPYPIGDRQMNGFMDLAQAGAFDERNAPTGLQVGAKVRINVGPYAEFTGVLEGYAKGRSARVMTWLFGREIIVDVKLAHIENLD